MFPLQTKQSGGKLLPHSDLRGEEGGNVSRGGITQNTKRDEIKLRRGGSIGSWWGNRREKDHWGERGVDGRIILGWICRRCGGYMD